MIRWELRQNKTGIFIQQKLQAVSISIGAGSLLVFLLAAVLSVCLVCMSCPVLFVLLLLGCMTGACIASMKGLSGSLCHVVLDEQCIIRFLTIHCKHPDMVSPTREELMREE